MSRTKTISTNLPDETIEVLDQLADDFDTDRATIVRVLLKRSLNDIQTNDVPASEFREQVDQLDYDGAIDMILDGFHPRWDQ